MKQNHGYGWDTAEGALDPATTTANGIDLYDPEWLYILAGAIAFENLPNLLESELPSFSDNRVFDHEVVLDLTNNGFRLTLGEFFVEITEEAGTYAIIASNNRGVVTQRQELTAKLYDHCVGYLLAA